MSVTREQLHAEIWAEPMTTVAARYNVSSNYLARVCAYLNVPRPTRGYWAKLAFGKAPRSFSLPAARPGEVLEWAQGDSVPRSTGHAAPRVVPDGEPRGSRSRVTPPQHHELVTGVRQHFEAGRVTEVGYLRPRKWNLVDMFVSKETLPYALETANDLFLAFEARGHRVALETKEDRFHRPELAVYEGQQFDYYNREPWRPGRDTVLYVGPLAFGLTLYELTEEIEVTYEWSRPVRYVRADKDSTKKRSRWAVPTSISKQHMPCGRLALRAYSPYGRVPWEQQWREGKVGELRTRAGLIAKVCEAAVPSIVERRQKAQEQAERERQRWEAESRERARQERERRRAEAQEESRRDLLAIVDAWSRARSIERFFEDAHRRAMNVAEDDRAALLDRLAKGRTLLGGTDALARFLDWNAPEENDDSMPNCRG